LTLPGSATVAQRVRPLGGIALLAACVPACIKQLPPAPTPPAVAPAVAVAAPPEPGHGRLVVDVVDGPTEVHRTHMESLPLADDSGRARYRFFEASAVLCPATPCVTDVPAGNVLLGFPVVGDPGAFETELVHVGPEPSVYRRALSEYHGDTGALRVLGIVGTSVGAASAITGVSLLPIGLSKDNDGLATAGGISLGAGVALIAFGIWAIRHDAPTYRPGSSNHFPLDAAR